MTGFLRVALAALLAAASTGCLIPVPAPGWDDDDHHQHYRRWDGDREGRDDRGRWDHDGDRGDRDGWRDWRR